MFEARTVQKCEAQKIMFEAKTAQKRQQKQDTFQHFADFVVVAVFASIFTRHRKAERAGQLGPQGTQGHSNI